MEWNLPTDDPTIIGIYAAIVLTGVVHCFFGYRIFKYALAIILALAGAGAGAYVAVQLGLSSEAYTLGGIGLGALVGLLLSLVFVKTAAGVAGAFLGYALLSPQIGDLEPLTQILLLVAGCGVGAVLGILFVRFIIIVATAFIGSFQVVYGALFFLDGTQILILGEDPAAGWQLLAARQVPFIAMIALGALGVYTQLVGGRRRRRPAD